MDYKDFHRYCLTKSGQIALNCGSGWERPLQHVLQNPTDFDQIFYRTEQCAIPSGRNVPNGFTGTLLIIDSEGNHAGFAKLRKQNPFHIQPFFTRPTVMMGSPVFGPALEWFSPVSPDVQPFLPRSILEIKQDKVYAIRCPYWPPEAEEWRLRRRIHGWPDERLINRTVRGGCHFVAKKHPKTTFYDVTEWRFSFSKAELLLVHSWTPVQKYVYHRLRIIKSNMIIECGGENETFLHTYYFKTLMLWACERKSPEFWKVCNVEACISELIADMIEYIIERNCPNYFIPRNNMMDHLEEEDLSRELQWLVSYAESTVRSCFPRFAVHTNSLLLEIPNRLLTWLTASIIESEFPIDIKLVQILESNVVDSEQFMPEIKFLYQGISETLRLLQLRSGDGIERLDRDLVATIFRCFDSAINCTDNTTSKNIVSLDESLYETIEQLVFNYVTNRHSSTTESLRIITECSTRLRRTSHSRLNSNEITGSARDSCSNTNEAGFGWLQYPVQQLFNRLQGNFPSPLYAVASAYRANFNYKVLGDYASTCAECDRVNDAPRHFADIIRIGCNFEQFPVIFCNKWSALFDEHIQVILGFVTLSEASLPGAKPKDVVLALSPLDLLSYLKAQSLYKLFGNATDSDLDAYRATMKPEEQPHTPRYVRRSVFSTSFFAAALRISIAPKKSFKLKLPAKNRPRTRIPPK